VEGGREEEPGAEDPEEGAIDGRPEPGACRDHRHHQETRRHPGGPVSGDHGVEEGEERLIEAPVLGVGRESGEESGARSQVGERECQPHQGEGDARPPPETTNERGKRSRRRHLHQGRQRQGGTRGHRPRPTAGLVGCQDHQRQEEQAQGVHMGTPRGLHHRQGGP
jgi:hypothetical protein